jgi:two-component system phosphate regulon sensor histidine kinase PhoR
MKGQKIKIIVAVMTLSVIGLIAMQIYWITGVVRVEEERFERKVNDALIRVAQKIDKQEAVKSVLRNIDPDKENSVGFIITEDKRQISKANIDSTFEIKFIKEDSLGSPGYKYHFELRTNPDSINKDVRVIKLDTEMSAHKNVLIAGNDIKWNAKLDSFKRNRTRLVNEVVTDIISINIGKKVEDRINRIQLNDAIAKELQNSGIDTDFYFGVQKSSKDTLVLLKEGANKAELKKSKIRTYLFPDEIFNEPNQLIIYFPNKNTYLLSSISGMLALSVILIVVITALFYKTLQMFITQKKITEIKNDLINNLTHEFKTPISTISVACEALKEPELVKEQSSVDRYTAIIKEENERLRMMVETLLNTAAFEKETVHITREEVDINEIILSVIQKFESVITQRNGKINFVPAKEPAIINADKFHLINVISNLIDNSIKYNEREPVIDIITSEAPEGIRISVTDNGIGIAKDHFDKIFETFYRVPTGNIHNVRGNGIGLSYSKQIVEAHGGKISVISKPGEGSRFEITLPLQ